MSETSEIVNPILDYCESAGIFAKRRNVAGTRKIHGSYVNLGTAGQSDIWGILRGGRHFECEVKLPGEEPSDKQLEWLRQCAAFGALAFWTDSLDDFIATLDKAQRGARA